MLCIPPREKKPDTTSIQIKLKTLFSSYFVYVKRGWNEIAGCEIPPWSQLFPSAGMCTRVYVQQAQGATHTNAHGEARRFKPLGEQKRRPCLSRRPLQILPSRHGPGAALPEKGSRVSATTVSAPRIPSSRDLCLANQPLTVNSR